MGVRLNEALHHHRGGICRAIINHNDFVGTTDTRHGSLDCLEGRHHPRFLVAARDQDRQIQVTDCLGGLFLFRHAGLQALGAG
jgi:hypothetical protein